MNLSVLVLDFCEAEDLFRDRFENDGFAEEAGSAPVVYVHAGAAWEHDDMFGPEMASRTLDSGEYHALIVVDLDLEALGSAPAVEAALRMFPRKGGVVVFCGSEGLGTSRALDRLYSVGWKGTSYFRSLWGPCDENLDRVRDWFGVDHMGKFSIKACTLTNVEPEDRCFGLVEQDPDQEIWQRDRVRPKDPEFEDYGICIAAHETESIDNDGEGQGTFVYFGDVNLEESTCTLIARFIRSRCSKRPIRLYRELDATTFKRARVHKNVGNGMFKRGVYSRALGYYDKALKVYSKNLAPVDKANDEMDKRFKNEMEKKFGKEYVKELFGSDDDSDCDLLEYSEHLEEILIPNNSVGRLDNPSKLLPYIYCVRGAQRDELVKILSNKAECCLRLGLLLEAQTFASQALELDPYHEKSLVRCSKSVLRLGNDRIGTHLAMAKQFLERAMALNGKGAEEAQQLLNREIIPIFEREQLRFGRIELTKHM